VDPRAGLDDVEKRKFLTLPGLELRPLVRPSRIQSLSRLRSRCLDNIKMDPREIGWDRMDWIYLGQDRDQWRAPVNTVMNFRVP
jgi:hypothetical protein